MHSHLYNLSKSAINAIKLYLLPLCKNKMVPIIGKKLEITMFNYLCQLCTVWKGLAQLSWKLGFLVKIYISEKIYKLFIVKNINYKITQWYDKWTDLFCLRFNKSTFFTKVNYNKIQVTKQIIYIIRILLQMSIHNKEIVTNRAVIGY